MYIYQQNIVCIAVMGSQPIFIVIVTGTATIFIVRIFCTAAWPYWCQGIVTFSEHYLLLILTCMHRGSLTQFYVLLLCMLFSLQISCTKVLSSWSVNGNVDKPILDIWLRQLGQIRGIRYIHTYDIYIGILTLNLFKFKFENASPNQ